MPAKAKKKGKPKAKPKKTLKKTRKPVKKLAPRAPAPPPPPTPKPTPALQCGVCGYRVIVDQTCGCVEEHILMCCGQPMAKTEILR